MISIPVNSGAEYFEGGGFENPDEHTARVKYQSLLSLLLLGPYLKPIGGCRAEEKETKGWCREP